MDIKFNSLFDNENENENKNLYNIDYIDNIGLDPRIKENPLILNNYDTNDYQKILEKRNMGNTPVSIISGRPCSTSLCNSNKFCKSSGRPIILYDVPISCKNILSPQGQKANHKQFIHNIDIESRLLNIDYKVTNEKCGKKDFKNSNKKSLECFKDILFKDDENYNDILNKNNNNVNTSQCNVYVDSPVFNESTKRIDTISW